MEVPMKESKFSQSLQKLMQTFGKYKYAAAVLLLGIVLMLWPQTTKQEAEKPIAEEASQTLLQTQEQLQNLLSCVEGAGRVQVMLSLQTGTESEFQTDTDIDRVQTVFAQDAGNIQSPVIRKRHYPVYRGAVIVCEGADSAAVRLRIVDAVCSLTGLGSDKVSVIKMKGQ